MSKALSQRPNVTCPPACPVRSKFATFAHAECFPSHLLLLAHVEIRAKIDDTRKIAIISCGTSAMILSHALLNHGGFEVTVFSEKTVNQWYEDPPTGTPFVAGENVDIERELGIEHWDDEMFFGDGIMLDFRSNKGAEPLTIRGQFAKLGAAVDLRTRVQRWMNDFVAHGGRLVIERVTPERVDAISLSADLTILATGKGELGSLIERDPERGELRRVVALQELASS